MKVICFGDSNTYGFDPRVPLGGRYGPDSRWVDILSGKTGWNIENQGVNGREVRNCDACFPDDMDLLMIMLGTNDLLQFQTPENTALRMEQFLKTLTVPSSKILLISPPAMTFGAWVEDQDLIDDSIRLGKCYRDITEKLDVPYLDLSEFSLPMAHDGVHLSPEGHRAVAESVINRLNNSRNNKMQPIVDKIDCISVQNMRDSDAYTIASLVPSLTLMYRAALGVYHAFSWKGHAAIVVGSGNNGGDGLALAGILHEHGCSCEVFTLSNRFSPDSAFYAQKASDAGIPVRNFFDGCLKDADIVVDCLLGTGFQGVPRENYRNAISQINSSGAFVISVDINSGMNGDTGAGDYIVNSDLTVTIGYVKIGLVSENAGKYIKRLLCAPIGIKLVREEYKILPADYSGSVQSGWIRCPAWLDMNPIVPPETGCP